MDREDFARSLQLTKNDGGVKPSLFNVAFYLREHDALRGNLVHSEMHGQPYLLAPMPWTRGEVPVHGLPWTEVDDLELLRWLEQRELWTTRDRIGEAVLLVASERPWHPVRAWLDGLVWDGTDRLTDWLGTYCGAVLDDYTRTVGPRWLVQAVARACRPGCKAHATLILRGPQGAGKSTVFEILGSPWFSDDVPDLQSGKDASLAMGGSWMLELAELDALGSVDAKRIKAFLTRATDRFRPAYGRRLVEIPRSSVLCGSTNAVTFLHDETGGRRFWPVDVGTIDVDGLRRDRDQLFAEAVLWHEDRAPWWLDRPELVELAAARQRAAYHEDPWHEDVIRIALHRWPETTTKPEGVTPSEVLSALDVTRDRQDGRLANRVVRILTHAGWESWRPGSGAGRVRRYRPPA
ncbi:MAG: virulence-associated E family protein [Pseudomonadota bacterium]